MQGRKRRREPLPRRDATPRTMHPRNRYAEAAPDFAHLASLYPSFAPFVSFSGDGRASVDFTDFAATRELTRVLLLHDHNVRWWIPDGQLCPTIPNRSNYIHWIEDLICSDLFPKEPASCGNVRGFDIGTGVNCIYPLLGASLLGWYFVGSDVTDIAVEWAKKNVESNPHLVDLIEIRDAREAGNVNMNTDQLPILLGVVKDGENFDFCMCNPPFFRTIEEAGLNPKTSCGGTVEEMVCSGGEQSFIMRIIDDSIALKQSFRWFTSMVGRKANLKHLVSKVYDAGASVVKTTEFVQGLTSRWGLAWSFIPVSKKSLVSSAPRKSQHIFVLEGLQRRNGAFQVLKSVESFFLSSGVACKANFTSFLINAVLQSDNEQSSTDVLPSCHVSVLEQVPGTVLVRASLSPDGNSSAGLFSSLISSLEESLKAEFSVKTWIQ